MEHTIKNLSRSKNKEKIPEIPNLVKQRPNSIERRYLPENPKLFKAIFKMFPQNQLPKGGSPTAQLVHSPYNLQKILKTNHYVMIWCVSLFVFGPFAKSFGSHSNLISALDHLGRVNNKNPQDQKKNLKKKAFFQSFNLHNFLPIFVT